MPIFNVPSISDVPDALIVPEPKVNVPSTLAIPETEKVFDPTSTVPEPTTKAPFAVTDPANVFVELYVQRPL